MTSARRLIAILLFLAPAAGCRAGTACPGFCSDDGPAILHLSCAPADLTSVALSGSCAGGDASPSSYLSGASGASLAITSPSPGACSVTLTFATGFIYSVEVTFVSQPAVATSGCPACPSYTVPAQSEYAVENPSTTCADAGDEG
jgi:hypothetical protein